MYCSPSESIGACIEQHRLITEVIIAFMPVLFGVSFGLISYGLMKYLWRKYIVN